MNRPVPTGILAGEYTVKSEVRLRTRRRRIKHPVVSAIMAVIFGSLGLLGAWDVIQTNLALESATGDSLLNRWDELVPVLGLLTILAYGMAWMAKPLRSYASMWIGLAIGHMMLGGVVGYYALLGLL